MPTSYRFLREFLRAPAKVGAITPSSRHLAAAMVGEMELPTADVILEFGAGTGVFTKRILDDKKPEATFWAFEINPRLVVTLQSRFPGAEIKETSMELAPQMLDDEELPRADCIVCGLPWASFDAELQERLLSATLEVLKPGGCFATFAYLQGLLLPGGKRFSRQLSRSFARVDRSPVIWRNLPPAFVYRCYA